MNQLVEYTKNAVLWESRGAPGSIQAHKYPPQADRLYAFSAWPQMLQVPPKASPMPLRRLRLDASRHAMTRPSALDVARSNFGRPICLADM